MIYEYHLHTLVYRAKGLAGHDWWLSELFPLHCAMT